MKTLKKNIAILAAIIILCYLCGLAGLFKPFMLFLATAYYGLGFMIISLVAYVVLPKSIKKKYAGTAILFQLLLILSWVLFMVGRYVINTYYMPESLSLHRVIAKCIFLLCVLFLVWNLFHNRKGKIVPIGISLYILFIVCGLILGLFVRVPKGNGQISTPTNLGGLGYVQWAPVDDTSDKIGVVKHDSNLAWQGYNLYTDNGSAAAILIDMDGNEVHRWYLDIDGKYGGRRWLAKLWDNGDLAAYCNDYALTRYRWDSREKWVCNFRPHHDITIDAEGNVYLPSNKDSVMRMWGLVPVPILDDLVTVVSPDGEIISKTPLARAARHLISPSRVAEIYKHLLRPKNFKFYYKRALFGKFAFYGGSPFDVLHTNSVDFFDRDIEGVGKKGDFVISMRNLDTIAVIDPDTKKFVWSWGPGQIDGQHNAVILKNNNILLFDNGYFRGYSRVIELDPVTFDIVWEYKAPDPKDFFSKSRCGSQRLPNGNTLITESDKGHVIEVTPSGQIVWEFYQPELSEDKKTRRSIRYMHRIAPDSSAMKKIMFYSKHRGLD